MILLLLCYLDKRFKNDHVLNRVKYLPLLSIMFIQDFNTLLISYFLISISVIDICEYKIPNELNISLLLAGLYLKLINHELLIKKFGIEDLITISFIIILFIISLISSSIGLGDVKLLVVLYLITDGAYFINMIFILSLLVFIFAIFSLIKNKDRKTKLPLAPFIYFSILINNIL